MKTGVEGLSSDTRNYYLITVLGNLTIQGNAYKVGRYLQPIDLNRGPVIFSSFTCCEYHFHVIMPSFTWFFNVYGINDHQCGNDIAQRQILVVNLTIKALANPNHRNKTINSS